MLRMTSQPKKINVNSSTLVDLKAELLRKQQEYRNERVKGKGTAHYQRKEKTEKGKSSVWSKSNSGVLDRAQHDLEVKTEQDATVEKSRSILEAKARLYEKITSGKEIPPEDDDGELFLVDFQKKAIDERLQKRLEERAEEEKRATEEQEKLKESVPDSVDLEEEWVDYVDEYGKNRCCLRKDLDDLKGQVKPLKIIGESELMSEDMRRELLRQKWEKEEEEMLNRPAGPVHYSNVQFDEVRSHGVGYYQFSKEEEERREQIEKLQQIRQQTVEQRERKLKLKEKRKAIMAARLAKVKQRRMITTTAESDSDDNDAESDVSQPVIEAEPLVRDDSWKKDAPVREWDKGKKADVDWMDTMRNERDVDFAPPSFYYQDSKPYVSVKQHQTYMPRSTQVFPDERLASTTPKVAENITDPINIQAQVNDMLSEIRSQSENDSRPVTNSRSNNCRSSSASDVDVSSIPLPQEPVSATSHNAEYHHTETLQQPCSNIPDFAKQNPYANYTGDTLQPLTSVPHSDPGFSSYHQNYNMPTQSIAQLESERVSNNYSACDTQIPEAVIFPSASIVQSPETATQSSTSASSVSAASVSEPATYSSMPVKYARPGMNLGQQEDGTVVAAPPVKGTYERVNLHQIPLTLPTPPTVTSSLSYPSQEDVITCKEKSAEKNWHKQFTNKGQQSTSSIRKTNNIPFPSPYVQSDISSSQTQCSIQFDPSKPPPCSNKDTKPL